MTLLGLKSVDRTSEKTHLVRIDKLANNREDYHSGLKGGENSNNTQTSLLQQTSFILGVQIKLLPAGTVQ